MTEPERMLRGSEDDIEVALLRSAELDAPSGRAVERTLIALGLGSGVTAASAAATAATATLGASPVAAATSSSATAAAVASAAKAGASLPPAAVATQAGISLLVKWVGIAGVASLLTWGAASQSSLFSLPGEEPVAQRNPTETPQTEPAPLNPPLAAPSRPETAAAEPSGEEPAAAPVQGASSVPEPATRVGAPTVASARGPSTRPAPHAVPKSLSEEVAALDKAQSLLDDDPEGALAALEGYDEGFRGGVLAQEAEVLRIEALAKVGQQDKARAAAATFLAKHPTSPLASRVRQLLR